MRRISVFAFIVYAVTACSFVLYTEPVVWTESRKLTWADFQRWRPDKSQWAAAVASEMNYNITSYRDTLTVTIVAQMRPELSWYYAKDTSGVILNHEQRHFDITEVHARKLRRCAMKNDGHTSLWDDINNELVYLRDTLRWMQAEYDSTTNHGRNWVNQQKWNKKIDSMLLSLDAFKTRTFKKGRFPAK